MGVSVHHHHFPRLFGRHGGGGAGDRFGGWFAQGGELGGRGFGMGRKLASADLQLLILGLLADKPRHGYEIIKALDERSKGFYTPSPGMVYPALNHLEEMAHATVEVEGTRKRYHITDLGRRYLQEHQSAADSLWTQFERVGERMDSLRRAMHAGEQELGADGESHGSKPLMRARRALKTALADKWDTPAEEQERIARILERAAEEIGGNKKARG
jgi:DNA-binding PadR family transcriptional regulator